MPKSMALWRASSYKSSVQDYPHRKGFRSSYPADKISPILCNSKGFPDSLSIAAGGFIGI